MAKGHEIRIPSTAAIYKHPIHPMLVTFPIAFLTGSLATDITFWFTRDPFWARAAFWLIAAGLGGGMAAALAGMADFFTVPRIRKLIRGWGHFLAAIVVVSFASVNFMLRWADPVAAILPWGLLMSFITSCMLIIAGYLGGKLVFHELVGTYLTEEEEP